MGKSSKTEDVKIDKKRSKQIKKEIRQKEKSSSGSQIANSE